MLTRTAQQIGGSFGTAVLAVVLEGALAAHPGAPAGAFHVAFWWSVGFSAVAVPLSLWLPGVPRKPGPDAAPEAGAGRDAAAGAARQADPVEAGS